MTCTYGASVRAGLDPTTKVLVDRSLWETVTGTPSSWWDWLLGVFPLTYITASDLCALNLADPVLPPLATIAAAFFRDPSSIVTVYNYVRDKLTYAAFANACVCNAPPLSPCDSAYGQPFSPLGSYATNGSGAYDQGMRFTAVLAYSIASFAINGEIDDHGTNNITYKLWDVTAGTLLWTSVNHNAGGYQEYAAPVTVTMIVGHVYALTFTWTTGMTIGYGGSYAGRSGPSYSTFGSIDNYPSGAGVPSRVLNTQADPLEPIACPSTSPPVAPTVPAQPTTLPVPPDWVCTSVGDVCLRLQQLSEKVDWLIRSAPAVTSSSVAEGTSHPGLTGSGTLVVSGILGLRVVLTTIPLSYGSYPGSPTVHFGVGRINWSTSEGWLQESLLDVTPKEILGFPPTVTSIGYSLPSGVVATVTELVKGP